MLSDKRKEQVLALSRQLIQQQSYSGHEDKAAAVLTEGFKKLGFDDVFVDRYGNTVGILRGKRPGKKVLFDGHMDTVPVTDEGAWAHKPFEAEVTDGVLYGRGATDMKGRAGRNGLRGGVFCRGLRPRLCRRNLCRGIGSRGML